MARFYTRAEAGHICRAFVLLQDLAQNLAGFSGPNLLMDAYRAETRGMGRTRAKAIVCRAVYDSLQRHPSEPFTLVGMFGATRGRQLALIFGAEIARLANLPDDKHPECSEPRLMSALIKACDASGIARYRDHVTRLATFRARHPKGA